MNVARKKHVTLLKVSISGGLLLSVERSITFFNILIYIWEYKLEEHHYIQNFMFHSRT